MRSVWNYLIGMSDNLYRARSASIAARMGNYQKAKEIMMSK